MDNWFAGAAITLLGLIVFGFATRRLRQVLSVAVPTAAVTGALHVLLGTAVLDQTGLVFMCASLGQLVGMGLMAFISRRHNQTILRGARKAVAAVIEMNQHNQRMMAVLVYQSRLAQRAFIDLAIRSPPPTDWLTARVDGLDQALAPFRAVPDEDINSFFARSSHIAMEKH